MPAARQRPTVRAMTSLRQRPVLLDTALAVVLAAAALVESTQPGRSYASPALMVPVALLVTLPLALRRRWPVPVLALGVVVETAAATVDTAPASAVQFLALLVAVYTVVVTCARSAAVGAVLLAGVGAAVVEARDPATRSLLEALPTYVVLAAVLVLARVVRRSREQAARMQRLASELAASRAEAEQLAAGAERLRIARDMHDVLAHSVSVMVLQTGAARLALHEAAPQVRALLEQVEEVGRQSLTELSDVLGVLRGPGLPGPRTPVAGDVDRLLSSVRAAGLSLEATGTERLAGLPLPAAHSLYRVVQESLTNALKHSPRSHTVVAVTEQEGEVVVEVQTGGALGAAPAPPASGHGLRGLAERLAPVGGTVHGGPTPDGGWRVRAVVPAERAASQA